MNATEKKTFSYWPYIIVGMLSCTGIINYLLVYYSNSVYSTPVSMSPYNDALKFDQKASELRCANDNNYQFRLRTNGDSQEIQITGNFLPDDKFNISGWSGRENLIQEELVVDKVSNSAKIVSKLSPGLWNIEVFGSGNDGSCNWRVVIKDTI